MRRIKMANNNDAKVIEYQVLKNEQDQYSLWLAYKDVPFGWMQVLAPTSKENCLKYINQKWKDMRPKSVRDAMGSTQLDGIE